MEETAVISKDKTPAGTVMTGVVTQTYRERGFGYISGSDSDIYFFNVSDVVSHLPLLNNGKRDLDPMRDKSVEFKVRSRREPNERHPRAAIVRVLA